MNISTWLHRFKIVRFYRLRKLALWSAKNMYRDVVKGGNTPIIKSKQVGMTPDKTVETIRQTPAYKALMGEWGQLDEDGILIAVSRQALEETIAMFEDALTQDRAALHQELQKARAEGRQSLLDELAEEQKKFIQGFAYRAPDQSLNQEREWKLLTASFKE